MGFSYHLDILFLSLLFLFLKIQFYIVLKNTQFEGNVFLHELYFPAVPNDPLVPTAVLGEDPSPSLSIPAWVSSPCMVERWNSLFYVKESYAVIAKLLLVSAIWRINK